LQEEKGKCDIFFPTDFKFLQFLYFKICGKDSIIHSHGGFVKSNADISKFRTKFGYNPIIEDYTNMSVFTTK